MTIHTVNLDDATLATLQDAKPANTGLQAIEAAIISRWTKRWRKASPAKREKIMRSLQAAIAEGQADAISR
jgi:hypothetical protein